VLARPGNRLSFTGRRAGCRAYVALAGGIDVPEVLGSRSTDLGSGFGGLEGRPLRAADRLGTGGVRGERLRESAAPPPSARESEPSPTLRVVLGPQDDHLTPESVARFLAGEYRVTAASDRVGCRLQGPRLEHARGGEIPSDGMVRARCRSRPTASPSWP
jgi:allophanate hydrolase subunit 2